MFVYSIKSGNKVCQNNFCKYVKLIIKENSCYLYTNEEAEKVGVRKCALLIK